MSNTDQNKNTSWKNRLNELDGLPGEAAPAKNIAWNKLHDRLREEKQDKNTYWYWAAAVFFIGTVITMIANNADPKTADTFVLQPVFEQKNPDIKSTTTIQPATKTSIEPIKKDIITVPDKLESTQASSKEIAANKNPVHSPSQIITITDPAITILNSSPVIDSTSTVVVPKKKLRVIHLNEISDPNQTSITESDNTNNGFRRFIRHYNKDVSVGDPAPANSGGHILIKNLNN